MDSAVDEAGHGISLCDDCALHPELKAIIAGQLGAALCGACGQAKTNAFVGDTVAISNAVRALIRYDYWEAEYTDSCGVSSYYHPIAILYDPSNKISLANRDHAHADQFKMFLFDDSYFPLLGRRITMFSGDGRFYPSLSRSTPDEINSIQMNLRSTNFHDLEESAIGMLSEFDEKIKQTIKKGTAWWRARIGDPKPPLEESLEVDFGKQRLLYPVLPCKSMGAPPPSKASAGRLNRQKVSFLYLASDRETAIKEVRPHPGQVVSYAQFCTRRDLRVADFRVRISDFSANDDQLNLFAIICALEKQMRLPVAPSERGKFTLTQLVAECLRRRKFDGILYGSSLGKDAANLCVFVEKNCRIEAESLGAVYVNGLEYTYGEENSRKEYISLRDARKMYGM